MKKKLKKFLEKYYYREEEAGDQQAYAYLKKYPWILDLGCNEGRFLKLNPKKIKGLDWSRRSIKICQKKGYQVIQSDARSLPFKKESVPAIHCSHLIEHFLPIDAHQILKEINRVLQPGGTLVIRSPLMWSRFYADLTHIKPYPPEALLRYLTPRHYQNTLELVSDQFQVVKLQWTYQAFPLEIRYLNILFNFLRRWGFPWLKKNGYLLILKKNG